MSDYDALTVPGKNNRDRSMVGKAMLVRIDGATEIVGHGGEPVVHNTPVLNKTHIEQRLSIVINQ
ncbi:MAG: hypothetical protein KAJ98_02040 [Spirochaetaceae bacterium]|nr:hypothetical protein [Spirochaetaceae bacterium]